VRFFPPFFLFSSRAVDENGDVDAGMGLRIEGALRCAAAGVGNRAGRKTGRKTEKFIAGGVDAQWADRCDE